MKYSLSEFFKNSYSLVLTKLFFPSARLIRRPFYFRGEKSAFQYGVGFTTGYRCRFELFGKKKGTLLEVGKNCKIGDQVHIASSTGVKIGDDCLIASNVYIGDTSHGDGTDSPLTPPDERPLVASPVTIGKCVWIGEGVAVLPGAVIGDGCVIGAHSVVKGNIPPFTVAVGAPARVVKRYSFDKKKWELV